jgi:hypothetical protein
MIMCTFSGLNFPTTQNLITTPKYSFRLIWLVDTLLNFNKCEVVKIFIYWYITMLDRARLYNHYNIFIIHVHHKSIRMYITVESRDYAPLSACKSGEGRDCDISAWRLLPTDECHMGAWSLHFLRLFDGQNSSPAPARETLNSRKCCRMWCQLWRPEDETTVSLFAGVDIGVVTTVTSVAVLKSLRTTEATTDVPATSTPSATKLVGVVIFK